MNTEELKYTAVKIENLEHYIYALEQELIKKGCEKYKVRNMHLAYLYGDKRKAAYPSEPIGSTD